MLFSGQTVKIRPPKVRDMRAVAHCQSDEERELALIGNLAGLTPDELDELELKEYKKLQEGLQGFLS